VLPDGDVVDVELGETYDCVQAHATAATDRVRPYFHVFMIASV
jgi:hypothetical protein